MRDSDAYNFTEVLRSNRGKSADEIRVTEAVEINNPQYIFRFHRISNVKFEEGLTFYNCEDLKAGVRLENCSGKLLQISRCAITEDSDNFEPSTPYSSGIILCNCQFEEVKIVESPKLSRGLTIKEGSKINRLKIEDLGIENSSISIEKSEIIDLCDITNINTHQGVRFDRSEVNCKVRVLNLKGGLSITNSQFKADIHIDKLDESLTFNNSVFEDKLYIKNVKLTQFTSYGDHFKKGLALKASEKDYGGEIRKIYILNTETGDGVEFFGGQFTDEVKIVCTDLLRGTFRFIYMRDAKLILQGLNKNANLSFKLCRFETVQITDFQNEAGLYFSTCDAGAESKSIFSLSNSDLGKATFFNFHFRDFNEIQVDNSIIYSSRFIACALFEPNQIKKNFLEKEVDYYPIIESDNRFARRREVFKQLRTAIENQGDYIQSSKLKSIELELYRQELKNTAEGSLSERWSLSLSSTNDMGSNWLKPLCWLLGITLAFYFPILICASPELEVWCPGREDFWSVIYSSIWIYLDNLYLFFRLLNPARVLSRLFESPDSNWIYVWDFCHRLALTFFTFQIVSAFRKYIK